MRLYLKRRNQDMSFFLELRIDGKGFAARKAYEHADDAAQAGHDLIRAMERAGFTAKRLSMAILSELPPDVIR